MLRPAERSAPEHWRSRAFGLELEGDFPVPGLPAVDRAEGHLVTQFEIELAAMLDSDWPDQGVARLIEESDEVDAAARTIDQHPQAGYRLYARGYGVARIEPDGTRVRCSPPELEPWRWQRFLLGRVLPWAAVLRGLEVFHASAVVIGERAVALIGPSGAGKTSLALGMVRAGAEFLTDDVLAVDERPDGAIHAHPGASIASLRETELEFADPRYGTRLGTEDKTYLSLPRAEHDVRLGAVYFLARHDGRAGGIEPLPAPDPRVLLSSTFVLAVQTPERLRKLLDISAMVARSIPCFRVEVDDRAPSTSLADALQTHAGQAVQR